MMLIKKCFIGIISSLLWLWLTRQCSSVSSSSELSSSSSSTTTTTTTTHDDDDIGATADTSLQTFETDPLHLSSSSSSEKNIGVFVLTRENLAETLLAKRGTQTSIVLVALYTPNCQHNDKLFETLTHLSNEFHKNNNNDNNDIKNNAFIKVAKFDVSSSNDAARAKKLRVGSDVPELRLLLGKFDKVFEYDGMVSQADVDDIRRFVWYYWLRFGHRFPPPPPPPVGGDDDDDGGGGVPLLSSSSGDLYPVIQMEDFSAGEEFVRKNIEFLLPKAETKEGVFYFMSFCDNSGGGGSSSDGEYDGFRKLFAETALRMLPLSYVAFFEIPAIVCSHQPHVEAIYYNDNLSSSAAETTTTTTTFSLKNNAIRYHHKSSGSNNITIVEFLRNHVIPLALYLNNTSDLYSFFLSKQPKIHVALFVDEASSSSSTMTNNNTTTTTKKLIRELKNVSFHQRRLSSKGLLDESFSDVVFMIVPKTYESVVGYFNVRDFPTLLITDQRDPKFFKKFYSDATMMEDDGGGGGGILHFLERFWRDELEHCSGSRNTWQSTTGTTTTTTDDNHHHHKSQSSSSSSSTGTIPNISQHNFQQMVIDNPKHVLVYFYAPWCGQVKSTLTVMYELARQTSHFSTLDIVKVNVMVEAELSQGYYGVDITQLPMMYLFHRDNKRKPVRYDDSSSDAVVYDLDSLISWLVINTSFRDMKSLGNNNVA